MISRCIYHHVADLGFEVHCLRNLPSVIRHQSAGALCFLSVNGVLRKTGRIYQDGAVRAVWDRGPKFGAFMKWCEVKGKL